MNKFVKFFILMIPAVFIAYGFWMFYSISGTRVLKYNPSAEDQVLISRLGPSNRVGPAEKNLDKGWEYQRITSEPVYFDVIMPRLFQKATIEVEFQNKNQPTLYLGVQDINSFNFETEPIHIPVLEERGWIRTEYEEKDYSIYTHEPFDVGVEELIGENSGISSIQTINVPVHELVKIRKTIHLPAKLLRPPCH